MRSAAVQAGYDRWVELDPKALQDAGDAAAQALVVGRQATHRSLGMRIARACTTMRDPRAFESVADPGGPEARHAVGVG